MNFHIVIPARFQSSRFAGKVLADIHGKPMLQHVWEKASQAGAVSVSIATDNEQVEKVARAFGATVVMTSVDHPTGTDRVCEVAQKLKLSNDDVVVNVQADEPAIPVENIQQVAQNCLNSGGEVATLCEPIHDLSEKNSPNVVKVVTNYKGQALYFSRAPIPYKGLGMRHVGLYAYKVNFLLKMRELYASHLEESETLEQLRWLYNGVCIHVDKAKVSTPIGVDTEEDLQHIKRFLLARSE